jgi:hypothetical protein
MWRLLELMRRKHELHQRYMSKVVDYKDDSVLTSTAGVTRWR